jgi:Lanthionine synthetase C-like protein
MGDEVMADRYPYGNLNCGLAHGIPGPLAMMSLALRHGVTVPGLSDAVDCAATWLAGHRADDRWGVNWPVAVPITAEGTVEAVKPGCADEPSRSAWCYGAPGVARALWLAGLALDRPDWRHLAVEAMQAVCRRPVAAHFIDSPPSATAFLGSCWLPCASQMIRACVFLPTQPSRSRSSCWGCTSLTACSVIAASGRTAGGLILLACWMALPA